MATKNTMTPVGFGNALTTGALACFDGWDAAHKLDDLSNLLTDMAMCLEGDPEIEAEVGQSRTKAQYARDKRYAAFLASVADHIDVRVAELEVETK